MNEPKTREQFYWAGMAGQDVELPAPKTRTQEFMKATAERMAQSDGDMKKSAYDADGSVAEAGGIASYVESHGSGLPDPTPYSDGTVLIKVVNEWKAQEGYGWEGEPAFETITWDGDTEGRESLGDTYYRVADAISVDDLVGSIFTYTEEGISPQYVVSQSDILESEEAPNVFVISVFDSAFEFYVITEDIMGVSSGVYFQKISNLTYYSLTAPSSVHTIDPKFIPGANDEFVINFTVHGGGGVTADKTFEEIEAAIMSGKNIFGKINASYSVVPMGMDYSFIFELYKPVDDELYVFIITVDEESEEPSWISIEKTYTLTPASQDQQSE